MTTFARDRGVLCLVTDRMRVAEESEPARIDALVAQVEAAARAGIDLVQVRERSLAASVLVALVERCVRAARGRPTRIVVNDRLDVALAAGADGVHLRADSFDPVRVRALVPPGFVVGRSVHAVREAVEVDAAGGVDYLLFGTVFATTSKPADHAVAGPDALDRVAGAVRTPVLGIGGIDAERLPAIVRTRAAGFAAIGFFGVGRASVDETARLAAAVETARGAYGQAPVRAGVGEWS